MKTQTTLFNLFSENKKEIKLTGYTYSMESDKLLLTVEDNLFTIISITPDDDDRLYLVEKITNEPFDDFYRQNLLELEICTEKELEQYYKKQKEDIRKCEYNQYLRLKAKFEPN